MFFSLAKTLGQSLTLPTAAVFAVVLATALLWTRFRRTARGIVTTSNLFLAVCAFTPLSSALLRPLEDRFPQVRDFAAPPTGAIVLGGAMDEVVGTARGTISLNEAAERMTEAVALSRRFPEMRLVFTGGSGRLEPTLVTEAAVARNLWSGLGVPTERMTFEDRSRDTFENALFTKEIVRPKDGETWLLITSASHMPRSIGIFRKLGFAVVPYPVDYRTSGDPSDYRGYRNVSERFSDLFTATHEWIGLVAYWLTGKTSALFPGP